VTIEVVAAVIRDGDGRLLTVRKQGTDAFMLPGGKREPGEKDLTALARELQEEIGCRLTTARPLGVFEGAAANEPGRTVRGAIYLVEAQGAPDPAAEIAELLWIDPTSPPGVRLAPLLETQVLPALAAQASDTK
jgi:8-oxo-dGTP diphosphatase